MSSNVDAFLLDQASIEEVFYEVLIRHAIKGLEYSLMMKKNTHGPTRMRQEDLIQELLNETGDTRLKELKIYEQVIFFFEFLIDISSNHDEPVLATVMVLI